MRSKAPSRFLAPFLLVPVVALSLASCASSLPLGEPSGVAQDDDEQRRGDNAIEGSADCQVIADHIAQADAATARIEDDADPTSSLQGMYNMMIALQDAADDVSSAELSSALGDAADGASAAVGAGAEWLDSQDSIGPGEFQIATERAQVLIDQALSSCQS